MMSRNVRLGIFIGTTFLILAAFIFIVGDISVLFRKPGYHLTSDFDTAGGLERRAVVKMAGVTVGYVKDIGLREWRARVTMMIDSGIRIPRDSKVTLSSLGLIGEKYLEILPGKSREFCRPDDGLGALPSASFEQIGTVLLNLGQRVNELSGDIKKLVSEETRSDLKQILDNVSLMTTRLNEWVAESRPAIGRAVEDASQAFKSFDQKVDGISSSLSQTLQSVRDTVSENRGTLKVDLEKIRDLILEIEDSLKLLHESLEKINRGQGTLGKLIQEPGLYEKANGALDDIRQTVQPFRNLKAAADIRAEYYGESRLWEARLGLALRFAPDTFVFAQLAQDPWKDRLLFSAQAGRRWADFAPRAGLIESTLGIGVDYFMLKDRLIWSLEGYDLNRDPRPRFRLASRIALLPRVYVVVGLNDFSLASKREFFFGMGWEIR